MTLRDQCHLLVSGRLHTCVWSVESTRLCRKRILPKHVKRILPQHYMLILIGLCKFLFICLCSSIPIIRFLSVICSFCPSRTWALEEIAHTSHLIILASVVDAPPVRLYSGLLVCIVHMSTVWNNHALLYEYLFDIHRSYYN